MMLFDRTEAIPLDASRAQAVGAMLAQPGTSDIADAHVVVCARTEGQVAITSAPLDLKRLDAKLRMIAV